MATNGNPKYMVSTYYPNGDFGGFQFHDTAESMIRDYRGGAAIKKAYGGKVIVTRCGGDNEEVLDPEAEVGTNDL